MDNYQEKEKDTQEEIARKRRERILARSNENNQDQTIQEETGEQKQQQSVFRRYQNSKDRTKMQQKLNQISKGVGLPIFLLTFLFPSEAVFSAALAALIFMAFRITSTNSPNQKKEPLLPGMIGQILSKFHHLDRLSFLLKISLNVLMSYLLASVLLNLLINKWIRLDSEL